MDWDSSCVVDWNSSCVVDWNSSCVVDSEGCDITCDRVYHLPHALLYFSSSRKDKFPWWTNRLLVCTTNLMPVPHHKVSHITINHLAFPSLCSLPDLLSENGSRVTTVYM